MLPERRLIPAAKRIVFERIPPYDKRSGYGLAPQQTAELFVYETERRGPPRIP